jgi:D-beta-D-heptose 7-phosphate kinase/D-beta-D-heptose 1-phosphate adenosyltransferase
MKPNILLIGDIMLDTYIYGSVTRLSPEAPIPIVKENSRKHFLGGAGNVLNNLKSINGNCVDIDVIFSWNESDEAGKLISHKVETICNRIINIPANKTTQKTRVIEDRYNTQMLRIDDELSTFKDVKNVDKYLYSLILEDKHYDAIILSDYAKGMIHDTYFNILHNLSPVIIMDPKLPNTSEFKKWPKTNVVLTPNYNEYVSLQENNFEFNKCRYIFRTEGRKGITFIDTVANTRTHYKQNPVEVFNVSGAGDTIVAVITTCLINNIDMVKISKIANKCGAYVVNKNHTAVIPKNIFTHIVEEITND